MKRSTNRRRVPFFRRKKKRYKRRVFCINACKSDFKRTRKKKNSHENQFRGAFLDTGAQRSVIGLKQAKAYCKAAGIDFKSKKSHSSFRFGDGVHKSLGTIQLRIPLPNLDYLHIDVDIVRPDVSLLIGLYILDQEQLIANNVDNELQSKIYGWSIPIKRKHGHMYVTWNEHVCLFTRQELVKLHRNFYHPSSSKLFNLLKRSKLSNVDGSTRKLLEDI